MDGNTSSPNNGRAPGVGLWVVIFLPYFDFSAFFRFSQVLMHHAFYSQIKNEDLDSGVSTQDLPRCWSVRRGLAPAQFWAWRWPKGQDQDSPCVPGQVLCDLVVIPAQWVRAKNSMRKWPKWC